MSKGKSPKEREEPVLHVLDTYSPEARWYRVEIYLEGINFSFSFVIFDVIFYLRCLRTGLATARVRIHEAHDLSEVPVLLHNVGLFVALWNEFGTNAPPRTISRRGFGSMSDTPSLGLRCTRVAVPQQAGAKPSGQLGPKHCLSSSCPPRPAVLMLKGTEKERPPHPEPPPSSPLPAQPLRSDRAGPPTLAESRRLVSQRLRKEDDDGGIPAAHARCRGCSDALS